MEIYYSYRYKYANINLQIQLIFNVYTYYKIMNISLLENIKKYLGMIKFLDIKRDWILCVRSVFYNKILYKENGSPNNL